MIEWYNANLYRSYPFVTNTISTQAQSGLVDALICLGENMPMDFSNDAASIRLRSVEAGTQNTKILVFQVHDGKQYIGDQVRIFVPNSAQRFATFSGATINGLSRGRVTVGDISVLNIGEYHASLVDRCISAGASYVIKSNTIEILKFSIVNTDRRKPLLHYLQTMTLPDTQSFEDIVNYIIANIPPWRQNFVFDEGTVQQLPSSQLTFKPGFNVDIQATNNETLMFSLKSDAGNESLVHYVISKIGTNDALADINHDGIVNANDVEQIRTMLQLPFSNDALNFVLKKIQDTPAKEGNIELKDGKGVRLEPVPEEHKIIIHIEQLEPPYA